MANHVGNRITVIGVVAQPRSDRCRDALSDAYVPRESFSNQLFRTSGGSSDILDRIRVRVDSLDRIDTAKALLRAIINKRHPDESFVVQ